MRAAESALKAPPRGKPLVEPTPSSGWVAFPRARRPERAPWHPQLLGLAAWAVKLPATQRHNIFRAITSCIPLLYLVPPWCLYPMLGPIANGEIRWEFFWETSVMQWWSYRTRGDIYIWGREDALGLAA